MPKIRGFKPDLWTDEDFVEVGPYARLLWMGMWNYACDNGHLQDKSKQIKMRVLPTDDVNCAELLRELETQGLIERSDGWITIPNLTHHQSPHKRWWVLCERPGCVFPDGASYGYSKRDSTVEQPSITSETTVSHGGSTADGDGEVMVKVSDGEGGTPRAKRATTLPVDWMPSDAHCALAAERGVDVVDEETKFRDWCASNGATKKDWDATFRNWLRNARPPFGNVRPITRPAKTDDQGRVILPPLPKGVFEQ